MINTNAKLFFTQIMYQMQAMERIIYIGLIISAVVCWYCNKVKINPETSKYVLKLLMEN